MLHSSANSRGFFGNRNISKHGFHHFLRWLQAQDKWSFSSLTIKTSCFLLFLCVNACQLAPFATQDWLPHGQWSLNGQKYSQGFTQKGRQHTLPKPGALSHCHYLQFHKKSPHLCMLLFWRVRSWLCKYEFTRSTIFFSFKLICKSWIILNSW